MNRLLLLFLMFVISTAAAFPQSPGSFLEVVRKIKPLESTKLDVQQVLYEFQASDDERYEQTFSNDNLEIEINYATGECSKDEDDDDYTTAWRVAEGMVVRISVDPDQPVKLEDLGIDISKFTKEQMYRDVPDRHIYHDKAIGLAIDVNEGEVENITFFPSKVVAKINLCKGNEPFKKFYSEKSYFSQKLEDRTGTIYCPVANVIDVTLSAAEVFATGEKTIVVTTTARDPENDVLTYKYFVSGGTIKGSGPKVTWDLAGVPPGTYTLTAGVDDGCGICGATVTKTMVVK